MIELIVYLVGVVFAWGLIGVMVYIHKREDDPFPIIYSLFSWIMVIALICTELFNRMGQIKFNRNLMSPHLIVKKIHNKFKK